MAGTPFLTWLHWTPICHHNQQGAEQKVVIPQEASNAAFIYPSPHYIAWFVNNVGCASNTQFIDLSSGVPTCKPCPPGQRAFNSSAQTCAPSLIYIEQSASVSAFLYFWFALTAVVSTAIGSLIVFYRDKKIIRATAPTVGVWSCVGGLLASFAVLALALPLSNQTCGATMWLSSTAFVISFAALFARTHRIFKIFNNPKLQNKVIKDQRLLLMLACFVIGNTVISTVWQAVDPLVVVSTQVSEFDAFEYSRGCASQSKVFEILSYVFKAALTCWGIHLAYETRDVDANFNESRFIGLAIYNVALMCAITIPIISLLQASMPGAATLLRGLVTGYIVMFSLGAIYGYRLYLCLIGEGDTDAAAAGTARSGPSTRGSASQRQSRGQSLSALGNESGMRTVFSSTRFTFF